MIHIAKFSANGIFYRSELRIDRDHIRYRVSEVAPPMKKKYRYYKVTVTKTFKKLRIFYRKTWYNYKVPRYKFMGRVDHQAFFRLDRWEDRIRFRKVLHIEHWFKTKTYSRIKRKRIFSPPGKFHEFRNSFEFSTWVPNNRDILQYPYFYTKTMDKAHALFVEPPFLHSFEGTNQMGIVKENAPRWFTNQWGMDDREVWALDPVSMGRCDVAGVRLRTELLSEKVIEKCRRLDDWVRTNGLSDETNRFLSDELNSLPFVSPLKLPFFNRQDQIYAIDESNGIIGFNRGLSNLRKGYIDYFKSNVHGLTFLGESPEAFKMFLEIIQKLSKVLLAAKKGNFVEGLSILGLTSKKGVASDWLMLQYGIKPLIADLKTLSEEFSRKETQFFKFRFREFREFTLGFTPSDTLPLEPIFDYNCYVQIGPDDLGEWELDASCWNLAYNSRYDQMSDTEISRLTPPIVPHTYERLNDSTNDYGSYSFGVYDHFWYKSMRFDEICNYTFQKKLKIFSELPTRRDKGEYLLQRNYVLRTRTPAKYKWWEVLKLNELDMAGWELLPFSFVLDWFLPVGDYLEELASLRSLPKNIQFDLTIKDVVTDKLTGYQYSRCDRMRGIDSTKSAFLNLESISWDPIGHLNIDRLLNAAALLQQLRK